VIRPGQSFSFHPNTVIVGVQAQETFYQYPRVASSDQAFNRFSQVLISFCLTIISRLFVSASLIPVVLMVLNLPQSWIRDYPVVIYAFLSLFFISFAVSLAILSISLKWLLLGRFTTGNYAHNGPTLYKRNLVYSVVGIWTGLFGRYLVHSPPLVWFYRALGVKIGKDVLLAGSLLEWDLISIGDETVIEQGALIQPHTLEGRVMKMDEITIGARCWIGADAMIFPGAKLQDRVVIEANTLILRDDLLEEGTTWQGNPSESVALKRDWSRRSLIKLSSLKDSHGRQGYFDNPTDKIFQRRATISQN
jgi:non-ribosomal peptide synthetase-like protein